MQAPTTAKGTRVLYQEHDRMPIPEDVPELGIRGGRGRHTAAHVPAQHRLRLRHGHLLDGAAEGLGRRGDQTGEEGPLLHDGFGVGPLPGGPFEASRGSRETYPRTPARRTDCVRTVIHPKHAREITRVARLRDTSPPAGDYAASMIRIATSRFSFWPPTGIELSGAPAHLI